MLHVIAETHKGFSSPYEFLVIGIAKTTEPQHQEPLLPSPKKRSNNSHNYCKNTLSRCRIRINEVLAFNISCRWVHQVTAYFRNIAVNIWWTPLNRFNSTDCEGMVKSQKHICIKTMDQFLAILVRGRY